MKKDVLVLMFFVGLTAGLFRNYFFKNQVPFPTNLSAIFYQPWASYPASDYPVGPASKPIGFDNLRMFYPIRTVVLDQIKTGIFPTWNPYSFAGNTLLATYQVAIFHPLGWLFLILPQIDAWSLIVILAPIITSFFTYLFLKELGLGRKISLFGALSWGFCGMMIVWWEEMFMSVYSTLPLPLIFYGLYKLRQKQQIKNLAILILGFCFSILSGYFQTTLYLLLFSISWIVYLYFSQKQNRKSFLIWSLGGVILSFMICGVQIIPGVEAYINSARGGFDTKEMLTGFFAPLKLLATFLAPDFFGNPAYYNYFGNSYYHEEVIWIGIPAIFLVIYEVFNWKNLKSICKFFIISGIVILSLGFYLPTSWLFLYYLKIPFLAQLIPTRIFYLSSFCFAVVAAYGLKDFKPKKSSKPLIIMGLGFVILWIVAMMFYRSKFGYASVPWRNLIIPTGTFVILSAGILAKKRYYFLLGLSLVGMIYFANKYLYFGERRFLFPETPVISMLSEIQGIDRFWSLDKGHILRNFNNQLKLYSPEGYESFNIKRYNELVSTTHTYGKLTNELQRADVNLRQMDNAEATLNYEYSRKMMNILGIKYVLTLHESETGLLPHQNDLAMTLFWTDNIYDIWENETVFPRFFLTNKYLVEVNDQKIIDELYQTEADKIILEEKPEIDISDSQNIGELNLITYSSNKIVFKTQTDSNQLLYLSDNYFPGWKAFVDNQETKIYRTNYSFRSVVVPPGEHQIKFIYDPLSVKLGLLASGLGIVIFVGLIGYNKTWLLKK